MRRSRGQRIDGWSASTRLVQAGSSKSPLPHQIETCLALASLTMGTTSPHLLNATTQPWLNDFSFQGSPTYHSFSSICREDLNFNLSQDVVLAVCNRCACAKRLLLCCRQASRFCHRALLFWIWICFVLSIWRSVPCRFSVLEPNLQCDVPIRMYRSIVL